MSLIIEKSGSGFSGVEAMKSLRSDSRNWSEGVHRKVYTL